MSRRIASFAFSALAVVSVGATAKAQSNLTAKATVVKPPSSSVVVESDRIRDGLVGPVRRVRTEIAKLVNENGRLQEGKHAVLEVVAYDIKGNKIENQYFPVAGANLTGKEVYKYDDKGNISEMTLLNDDGSLLGKEIYKYEFDFAANWNKMTTSVAVIEGGRMSFEPTEVTYRSIMYYLDAKMMQMAQADAQPPTATPTVVAGANTTVKPALVGDQPQSTNTSAVKTKTSPSLPVAFTSSDKLTVGSGELISMKSVSTAQSPQVQVDLEPPPPLAPKPNRLPVSGGVLNGTAISLPPPVYPESARRLRMFGVVSVEVIVDETGKVISAHATSGPDGLRDVAAQAALKARFSPTKLSGQPVKVSGLITYRFSLAN
jgi:TonB family protein